MNLVTDRTWDDVQAARSLNQKGWQAMDEHERAAWLAGLKGAYNAADLNRVQAAAQDLAARLAEAGFPAQLLPQPPFSRTDIPTPAQMALYLSNVHAVAAAFYQKTTTPGLPESMDGLTYEGANAIEQVLSDTDELLRGMLDGFARCGELETGEELLT